MGEFPFPDPWKKRPLPPDEHAVCNTVMINYCHRPKMLNRDHQPSGVKALKVFFEALPNLANSLTSLGLMPRVAFLRCRRHETGWEFRDSFWQNKTVFKQFWYLFINIGAYILDIIPSPSSGTYFHLLSTSVLCKDQWKWITSWSWAGPSSAQTVTEKGLFFIYDLLH